MPMAILLAMGMMAEPEVTQTVLLIIAAKYKGVFGSIPIGVVSHRLIVTTLLTSANLLSANSEWYLY
jgi:putative AlgH/UPF0301 family transcriptional regulator